MNKELIKKVIEVEIELYDLGFKEGDPDSIEELLSKEEYNRDDLSMIQDMFCDRISEIGDGMEYEEFTVDELYNELGLIEELIEE